MAELKQAIRDFYGEDPKQSSDYGRVINRKNFDRLAGLIGSGTVAAGGQTDPDELYIAPTVLVDVPVDSPIMQEEVFGPILPVLEIDSVEAVIDWVNERPRPLGLYVFTEDGDVAERILEATNSGDACVNDCSVNRGDRRRCYAGMQPADSRARSALLVDRHRLRAADRDAPGGRAACFFCSPDRRRGQCQPAGRDAGLGVGREHRRVRRAGGRRCAVLPPALCQVVTCLP